MEIEFAFSEQSKKKEKKTYCARLPFLCLVNGKLFNSILGADSLVQLRRYPMLVKSLIDKKILTCFLFFPGKFELTANHIIGSPAKSLRKNRSNRSL